MAQVIWSPQALAELEAIGDFIAQGSPEYAQMLVDAAFEAVLRLERFPRSGRMVPEIGNPDIREILYRGYRVMYILTEEE